MSDNRIDPSGNTEAFRAFTETDSREPATAGRSPVLIGGLAAVVILLAVILWLTF